MSVRRWRGFGLVEVMVAMAILGIGLLAATALLVQGINRGAAARKLTSAQLLGGQILERLRTEIRYDAHSDAVNTGYSSADGGGFTLTNAWRAERLPYKVNESGGAPAGSLTDCNPSGTADGGAYHVGPFALRHEGSEYFVCYRIDPINVAAVPDAPANSRQATIKVLWRAGGEWAARWITGPLLYGG